MRRDPNENLKFAMIWRLGLLGFYGLFWLNVKHEMIVFAYSPLNYIAFTLVMLVPFLIIAFSFTLPRRWIKTISCVALLPLVIFSGFWLSLSLLALPYVIQDGQSYFLSKGKTIERPFWNLSYYHGDGYVIVTQEKEIAPGLLIVREIYNSGGPDPIIEILDTDTIRIVNQPGMLEQTVGEYHLNRFVYF